MRLAVRGHPGASRERVAWDGVTLHVWVTAHAAEGAANRALVRVVADWLGVRPSAVALVAGSQSRAKVIDVEGLQEGDLARLPAY
jgi:uncharacterized protein YggU (UPF0235/DUF167 family)